MSNQSNLSTPKFDEQSSIPTIPHTPINLPYTFNVEERPVSKEEDVHVNDKQLIQTDWGKNNGTCYLGVPNGIAIDSHGFVYVADEDYYHRIQKFDSNGNFIAKWGSEGSSNGQMYLPQSITIDLQSFVYVADAMNDRIQKAKLAVMFK